MKKSNAYLSNHKEYKRITDELDKLANMSNEAPHTYALSLKYHRDFINVLDTAKQEGIEQGIKQEKIKAAIALKKNNASIELIMVATELTREEIEQLSF